MSKAKKAEMIEACKAVVAPLIVLDHKKADDKGVVRSEPSEDLTQAYYNTLPDGLTREQADLAHDHKSTFIAAVYSATGDAGFELMKKHKDVTQVVVEVPLTGKDTFTASVLREKSVTIPGKDEPVMKYGVMQADLNTYEASHSVGELKKIKVAIGEKFAEAFAK